MTTFIRVIEPAVDEKPAALLTAVRALHATSSAPSVFERAPEAFSSVPGSPFSYWVNESIRSVFTTNKNMTAIGGATKCGLGTLDDFRFLRLWWESMSEKWIAFPKGGTFSRWYSSVPLTLDWLNEGTELKTFVEAKVGSASRKIQAQDFYFRPGLTWPRRTQAGFGIRAMPRDSIFADKGPAAFVEGDSSDQLLALLAVATSSAFSYLVQLQMAFGSYEVGVIQRTPLPKLSSEDATKLVRIARRAWSLKRSLDTSSETSHAFLLPSSVGDRATGLDRSSIEQELTSIQTQLDELVLSLYGMSADDRATIEAASKRTLETNTAEDTEDDVDQSDGIEEDETVGRSDDLLASWLIGVAFGRFDPRLATGERAIPPEPEPFDPLPSRSPGMYPEGEEPAERPDILVDDEGRADDLASRAIAVAERVKVDAPENLRTWLAKEFFPLHIKMYSKSRRKAPIYWQLATPSAGYSVWLYLHAFSKDTLFRVQNDYVAPKLAHEERRLESLTSELRDGATAAQRKQLAAQETLVEELRAFLDEVKRVAPLWNPNLDDGVIINFAPLWRLVPQNKSWQKELKSTWDALADGKYDWARLAMHLWPERVVPKCAKDRSLAIAHGLEDAFWVEGTDGKWTARKTPTESVDELVKERTSPAVKSALKSLLEAPMASGTAKKTKKGKVNA
jgi:hypothetical protein